MFGTIKNMLVFYEYFTKVLVLTSGGFFCLVFNITNIYPCIFLVELIVSIELPDSHVLLGFRFSTTR